MYGIAIPRPNAGRTWISKSLYDDVMREAREIVRQEPHLHFYECGGVRYAAVTDTSDDARSAIEELHRMIVGAE